MCNLFAGSVNNLAISKDKNAHCNWLTVDGHNMQVKGGKGSFVLSPGERTTPNAVRKQKQTAYNKCFFIKTLPTDVLQLLFIFTFRYSLYPNVVFINPRLHRLIQGSDRGLKGQHRTGVTVRLKPVHSDSDLIVVGGGPLCDPEPAIRDYTDTCPYLSLQLPRSSLTEL